MIEDVRWYLGLKGLMLHGKGMGIETVEANSPAAMTRLKPGIVITKYNSVVIIDDAVFGQVIAKSSAVLAMEVLDKIDGEPLFGTIQMTRLASASF